MRKHIILWDFDGTLADTLPLALAAYNQLATEHGFRSIDDPAAVRNQSMKQFLKSHHVPTWRVPGLFAHFIRDIEAARASGVAVGCVGWGLNSPGVLEECSPDFLADSIQDLPQLISQHFFRENRAERRTQTDGLLSFRSRVSKGSQLTCTFPFPLTPPVNRPSLSQFESTSNPLASIVTPIRFIIATSVCDVIVSGDSRKT